MLFSQHTSLDTFIGEWHLANSVVHKYTRLIHILKHRIYIIYTNVLNNAEHSAIITHIYISTRCRRWRVIHLKCYIGV